MIHASDLIELTKADIITKEEAREMLLDKFVLDLPLLMDQICDYVTELEINGKETGHNFDLLARKLRETADEIRGFNGLRLKRSDDDNG